MKYIDEIRNLTTLRQNQKANKINQYSDEIKQTIKDAANVGHTQCSYHTEDLADESIKTFLCDYYTEQGFVVVFVKATLTLIFSWEEE